MNRRSFVRTALGATAIGALNSLAQKTADVRGAQPDQTWICETCGTQYPAAAQVPPACIICQDSRQYVRWAGQKWTTPDLLSQTHKNVILEEEPGLYSIHTQADFAIGERALLVKTPEGNLLWDCVALLDEHTKAEIQHLGGISAIAISHPHY
jgi:hypothetical protein